MKRTYACGESMTKYYNVLLQYYKVLLQYYSVLQRATPVPLRTAKYCSSTTVYYKVLLYTTLFYKVLQHTTPHTKYYSSTTLYYNVLLQYYLCTTKYNSSTTLSYKVALMIETSFTMRGTTSIILQLHQILRLP